MGERNVALESCRGIAATMVVLYHLAAFTKWPSRFPPRLLFSNGDAGVTLFFVLSGFLLWRPFADAIFRRERTWSARRFLRNRALRILPAYWIALTVVAVVSGGVGLWNYLLVMNYTPHGLFSGISPAWSLSLEAVFYLLLPVVGAAGLWLSRRARNPMAVQYGVIAAWMGASLAFKTLAWLAFGRGPADAFVHFSFFAKAHLFGFGMILAVWHARDVRPGPLTQRRPWLAPAAGALIVIAAISNRYSSAASQLWFDTVTGLGFALLILPLVFHAGRPAGAPRRMMSWRPLVWLGTASYSLYLWHHPLLDWMNKAGLLRHSMSALILNLVVALVACIGVAALSYLFVERPFLRMRVGWSTFTRRRDERHLRSVAP